MVGPRLYIKTINSGRGDLGKLWTKEEKERLKRAILKVRKLEGLD